MPIEKVHAGQAVQEDQGPNLRDGYSTGSRTWLTVAPVLVLNLNYVPINVCTVRRAVVMLGKGKAEILENHRGELRSFSAIIEAPSIIRLVYLVKRPFLPRKLSKKEVFLRDRFTCQYCGRQPGSAELTIDHVQPRSLGGTSRWDNCVLACVDCNSCKADRTPSQASMKLRKEPVRPSWRPFYASDGVRIDSWQNFVNEAFWNVELES